MLHYLTIYHFISFLIEESFILIIYDLISVLIEGNLSRYNDEFILFILFKIWEVFGNFHIFEFFHINHQLWPLSNQFNLFISS